MITLRFSDLTPPTIKPKTCENVSVVHVVSPEQFYCRFTTDDQPFFAMEKKINQLCRSPMSQIKLKLKMAEIGVDQQVLAFSQMKKRWCRGKVVKVGAESEMCLNKNEFKSEMMREASSKEQANEIEIYLIDYGSLECIALKHLRRMTPDIVQENNRQSYCHECALINLKPCVGDDWTAASAYHLEKITKEKVLRMGLINYLNGKFDCDLSWFNPLKIGEHIPSMSENLVWMGLAKFRLGESQTNFIGGGDEFEFGEVMAYD